VALIGCLRPAPRVADLDRLCGVLEAAGARRLALGALADGAVHDLVADTIAAEPGPGLLAELAGAAGNPLFVAELLGALIQEGAIRTAGGRAEVAETTLPPTLRLTILRRLSFLPDDTLQALQAASILGSSFTVTELSVTTARPVLELSRMLAEAITGRVLEDDGDRLRFRHDLIRDAIYEDLPGSVRRGLHREAGRRLAGAGAAALQVAEQLARGAGRGDAEAIGWLARAAREAAPTSPDVAADLLDRATRLMNPADPGRDHLLAERASSLMWAGRTAAAEDLCRSLLDRDHDPSVEGLARTCLGHALLVGGRPRDGLRELERAGQSSVLTSAEQASALGWASVARRWLGDLDGSAATAEKARSAAAAAGDHQTTAIAMASLASVSELRGRLRDALRVIDDAVRLADRSPGRQGHRYPLHGARSFILVDLDRIEEARSALDTDRRISEELGLGWHLPSYQMVRAAERFVTGEWDDAVTEIQASLELAGETRQAFGGVLGRSVLSLISLHRNQLSRAEEAAAVAMGQVAETGIRYRAQWALWARALILEAAGKTADALATLAGCWDQCTRQGLRLEYRMLGPDLVRLALAGGDRGRAREVAAAVAELAAENQEVPSLAGAALRCRGLAEDDAEVLGAAVAAYASGSRPLELALACEDAGAAFARQGDMDRARGLLEQAVSTYERLGAARDLARAEAALRQAGIRRGRRGPRGRPRTGWHSLTPTERSVAELVTEGLSNPRIGDRLYISRRTVQTHLAHVFAKLDLTSRAQLAAVVTQHRGDQP
jgi:DNA-binding CsgD family transcriptional regulator